MEYDFKKIEQKWQAFWAANQTFKAEIDPSKPKYYVLDMFPYPSGAGLHVGHPLGYPSADVAGGVDVAGSILLNTNLNIRILESYGITVSVEVKNIVKRGDGRAVLYDDDLNTGCIGVREVNALLALFCNGHTSHTHIVLAFNNAADNRTELNVLYLKLHTELVSDSLCDLNVDTYELVALNVLIRGESSVGSHNENVIVLVTGSESAAKGDKHKRCDYKRNYFFHFMPPKLNLNFVHPL